MRDLYDAGSLHEAQLLVHRLQECGIKTVIRNEYLQGALGELPLTARPIVSVVNDTDWARAQDEVRLFEEANRSVDGPERSCPQCGELSPGNFQLCWSCRAPLSER